MPYPVAAVRGTQAARSLVPASLVTSGMIARWNAANRYSDAGMTTLAADGVRIAAMSDQTGNTLHATQATPASLGPIYRSASLSIEGNGTNRFMTIPAGVNPNRNSVSVAVVATVGTPATTQAMLDIGPNFFTPQIRGSQFTCWKFTGYNPTGFLPGSAKHVFHACSGANFRMAMSGRMLDITLPSSSAVAAGGSFLRGNAAFYWVSTMQEVVVYNRQLTAAEIAQNERYFATVYSGLTLATATKQVVFKGDSITAAAQTGSILDSYPAAIIRNAATPIHKAYNLGVASQTLQTMASNYATEIAPLYNASYGANGNILIIFAGTNDLAATRTGAQVYADYQTICAAARATGFKIIIASPIDRATTGLVAGWDTQRQNLRTLFAGDSSFADTYVDLAADTTIGVTGTALDTTYFQSDKTHPTDVGYQYLATLLQSAVDTWMAA